MNELFNHTFQLGHHTLTVFEIFEATLGGGAGAHSAWRRALGRSTWLWRKNVFRIWFVAALVALGAGVDLTALWAGSAALWWPAEGFFDVVSAEGGIAVGHILEERL